MLGALLGAKSRASFQRRQLLHSRQPLLLLSKATTLKRIERARDEASCAPDESDCIGPRSTRIGHDAGTQLGVVLYSGSSFEEGFGV